MTVTAVRKDADALTMTVDAELQAAPERVWELWADPRQLERWWGPPGYPATFTTHDFRVGGRAEYFMTGPEGRTPAGFWEIVELDPPRRMAIRDGFVESEDASIDLPGGTGLMNVTIEPLGDGRTRMSIENVFPDVATMEQLLAMGQEEGMKQALGQIDAILAEDRVAGAPR